MEQIIGFIFLMFALIGVFAVLAAVDSNAVIEGDDATTDASISTTRAGNYTQISDKVARVTGTQGS